MSNIISTNSNINFTMPPSGVQLKAVFEPLSYFNIASDGEISASEYLRSLPEGSVELEIPFAPKIKVEGFYQCKSLKSIKVYADSIGGGAFKECIALRQATLSVKVIENLIFQGCTVLSSVSISSNIQSISSSAFRECGLNTIQIAAEKDYIRGAPWGAKHISMVKWLYS